MQRHSSRITPATEHDRAGQYKAGRYKAGQGSRQSGAGHNTDHQRSTGEGEAPDISGDHVHETIWHSYVAGVGVDKTLVI